MKRTIAMLFNLVVVALSFTAILGYFFKPIFCADVSFYFTPEIADLILVDSDNPELSQEDQATIMMIKELAEERICVNTTIKLETADVLNCGLSPSLEPTTTLLYSITDNIADGLNKEQLQKIENLLIKAMLKTVVKNQINQLIQDTDTLIEDVLTELSISEEYLTESSQTIINSIRSSEATVDTVTDTVMTIVDDVYTKIEDSSYAEKAELTTEQRAEIEANVSSLLGHIAEDDGSISDEFIITFISDFIGSLAKDNSATIGSPNALFSIKQVGKKPYFDVDDPQNEDSSISSQLKEYLRSLITPVTASIVKKAIISGLVTLAISWLAWLWIIIKIVIKVGCKNPLVKLKCPILFGWTPFIYLYLLPTLLFKLLANPPAFLTSLLGADLLHLLTTLFNSGFTAIFTSSALLAFICAVLLFVFGIFYSAMRRSLKKQKE